MKLSISFYLKSAKEKETTIIAMISFGYKEFDVFKMAYVYKSVRFYTGVKVTLDDWDELYRLPFDENKRTEILKIKKTIEDVYFYLSLNGKVTRENLKAELDFRIKGKDENSIVKRVRIVDFIEHEILKSTHFKPGTIDAYINLKNKLINFELKINRKLNSNDINEAIYTQFLNEVRLQMSRMNSVWSVHKTFKAVLRQIARKYKIEVFDPSKELTSVEKIHAVSEDKLYLTFDQIEKIIDYVPEADVLQNTKLILLTLLFTGCRYSDVHKIKPEFEYDKNGIKFFYARYISEKTNTEIIVPLLKPLMAEVLKNGGKMANEMSLPSFNSYVKELTQACGLNDEISFSYTDSIGKRQFETKYLYEFVSSHIGRRSFVTNLINYIPITILTKITGHQLTDKSIIFSYNKISLLDNAVMFVNELERAYTNNRSHFKFELV